jgi:uncharacterized protein YcfJ
MYSDNLTQKVAQAVAKIMDEELKGNKHKIDANKNGKIDAEDFKLLKKKPVNEVADEDYAAQNVYDKAHMAHMSKNKNIPADKQQAAELEAHKHALETMKMKYPHHTASKGEGQVYRLSQEEVNEGLTGAAIGGTIGGLAGGPVGAAVGGYIGHKVQQTHAKEKALKAAQARNNPPRKKLTKEDQEFIDELNKSTLGSYVNASARDAVHRTAREVETGRLDKMADKRMKGIKLATKKLAKEEQEFIDELAEGTYKHEVEKSFPASGVKTGDSASKGTSTMPKDKDKAKGQPAGSIGEGYYKDIDTNRKEDERLAKKDSSPFGKPDKKKTKIATPGKFGYGYSAARHLARQGMASVTKEETEQVDEVIQKTSSGYIHHARPGVYGGSEKEKHVVDTLRGPKKSEIEAIEKEKKVKKFSEMLDLINTHGLKALSEMIKEEPDNEQFTQELKDAQAKSEGKGKKAEVAKGAVQAVKVEEETIQVEVLDFNEVNGVKMSQLDESHLTAAQSDKKEEIVKSMKKGLSGFKARYGDRAKEVMYATATKQAKK